MSEDAVLSENTIESSNNVQNEICMNEQDARRRLAAIQNLQDNYDETALWQCIVVFQNTVMWTASGLPFQYKLKVGRNGTYTKELWVDRRESSKSLAWSSVKMAFEYIEMHKYRTLVERPKALGDIRGVSYIYALFYNFGLIDVPDKFKAKMQAPFSDILLNLQEKPSD